MKNPEETTSENGVGSGAPAGKFRALQSWPALALLVLLLLARFGPAFLSRGQSRPQPNDISWLPRAVAQDHQWFTNHIAARKQ